MGILQSFNHKRIDGTVPELESKGVVELVCDFTGADFRRLNEEKI